MTGIANLKIMFSSTVQNIFTTELLKNTSHPLTNITFQMKSKISIYLFLRNAIDISNAEKFHFKVNLNLICYAIK